MILLPMDACTISRFQMVLWKLPSRPNKKELYSWEYSTKRMVTIGEKELTGGTNRYHTAFGMESHVIKPIATLSVSLWPKTSWLGLFQEVWGNFVICRVCVKVTTTGFQAILLRFCLPTWPPSFVLIFLLMNCLVRFPLKSYQIIFAKSSTLLPIGKGSLWWNSKGYWELDWAASSQSRRKHIEWHDSEEYCQIEEALVFGSWKWK